MSHQNETDFAATTRSKYVVSQFIVRKANIWVAKVVYPDQRIYVNASVSGVSADASSHLSQDYPGGMRATKLDSIFFINMINVYNEQGAKQNK